MVQSGGGIVGGHGGLGGMVGWLLARCMGSIGLGHGREVGGGMGSRS